MLKIYKRIVEIFFFWVTPTLTAFGGDLRSADKELTWTLMTVDTVRLYFIPLAPSSYYLFLDRAMTDTHCFVAGSPKPAAFTHSSRTADTDQRRYKPNILTSSFLRHSPLAPTLDLNNANNQHSDLKSIL